MLATLPEELIIAILSYLHNSPFVPPMRYGDRPQANISALDTLRSISLISRQLHRLVEPVLYHTYDGMVHSLTSLQMFLRTLLERSELGEQVRDLNLVAVGGGKVHQLQPYHLDRVCDLGLSHSLAAEVKAILSWRMPRDDADIVLLMALCPNVQKLEFRFRYYTAVDAEEEPSLSRRFLEEVSAAHALMRARASSAGPPAAGITWPTQALGTRYHTIFKTNELELLGPVLRDHGSHLEELTLQRSSCPAVFHGALQMAELRSWPRLKKLRAPEAMLLHDIGWVEDISDEPLTECLPSTLEFLEIHTCSTDEHMSFYTDAQIADLLNDERFAALRKVEVAREKSRSATDPMGSVKQSAVNIASPVRSGWKCEVFRHRYQSDTFIVTLTRGGGDKGTSVVAWKTPEELFARWDPGEEALRLGDELDDAFRSIGP